MKTRKIQAYDLENDHFYTKLSNVELLNFPLLNKGTAFSAAEREQFKLKGLLPPHIETIEQQVARCYQALAEKDNDLQKHIYLRQLQDENETLFYRLVIDHLAEIMPLIYTPTVGLACQQFSRIYRRPRGLFISWPQRDEIKQILDNSPLDQVKVIVVTDGERILGLGDQGVGGMGIPIGKLSLYSACGGIHPINTLPVILDVGTNNVELRNHANYIGWRHERIRDKDYFDFVDQFVSAVIEEFPDVFLQFEDFAQPHAYPLLQKYRDKLCCFNDDIQGTACVCVGAVLSATKSAGKPLKEQNIAVFGAGSAGCGISEQLVKAMMLEGLSESEARQHFFMIDRNGLLLEDSEGIQTFQAGLLQKRETVASWKLKNSQQIGLEDVVNNANIGILLGVSGQPQQFSESIVTAMAKHADRPIIFPMSNPTSRCEAQPADLIRWTQGRALIATGSPFDPVNFNGKTFAIAQCNNCYVFPGMGLGILAAGIRRVSDEMFMAASLALSEMSPALKTAGGALLPSLNDIRAVSRHIAIAIAKQAQQQGLSKEISDRELEKRIDETMWEPHYYEMVCKR